MNWRNFLKPGCLHPVTRVVYFILFLVITILQTYFALKMEEDLSDKENSKYTKVAEFN